MDYLWLLTVPVQLAVVWCAALRLLAWSGGWTRLARAYPGRASPSGVRLRDRWIGVGWVDYNGCVVYVVNAEGLHVALWPIFNLGHAPLFIPWAEMRVEHISKQFGRRGQIAKVVIGEPAVARLRLPKNVFEAGKQVLAPPAESQATEFASEG